MAHCQEFIEELLADDNPLDDEGALDELAALPALRRLALGGTAVARRHAHSRAEYEAHVLRYAPHLVVLDGAPVDRTTAVATADAPRESVVSAQGAAAAGELPQSSPPDDEQPALKRELSALRRVVGIYEEQARGVSGSGNETGSDGGDSEDGAVPGQETLLARWRQECLKLIVASEVDADRLADAEAAAAAARAEAERSKTILGARLEAEGARADAADARARAADAESARCTRDAEEAMRAATNATSALAEARDAFERDGGSVLASADALERAVSERLAGFEARLAFAGDRLAVSQSLGGSGRLSTSLSTNASASAGAASTGTQQRLARLPATELATEVDRLSNERAALAAKLSRAQQQLQACGVGAGGRAGGAAPVRAQGLAATGAAALEAQVAAARDAAADSDRRAQAAEERAAAAEHRASEAEATAAECEARAAEAHAARGRAAAEGAEATAAADAARAEATEATARAAEAQARVAQCEKRYERDVASTELRCAAAERERDAALAKVDELETALAALRREHATTTREAARAALAQRAAERALAREHEQRSERERARCGALEERLAAREVQLRALRRERSALLAAVRQGERPKAIRRDTDESASAVEGINAAGTQPLAAAGVRDALASLAEFGEELLADDPDLLLDSDDDVEE